MQCRNKIQVVNQIVDELCDTGYFERTEFRNDNSKIANAIRCMIPAAYFNVQRNWLERHTCLTGEAAIG